MVYPELAETSVSLHRVTGKKASYSEPGPFNLLENSAPFSPDARVDSQYRVNFFLIDLLITSSYIYMGLLSKETAVQRR